jgi:hypothetical protein
LNDPTLHGDHNRELRAQLIAEIRRAFAGVKREDGITLHEARAIDDYADDEERAAARVKDTDERWEDVPSKHIAEIDPVLSYLDAKGFRYYIPAYMTYALVTNLEGDDLALFQTVCALGGRVRPGWPTHWLYSLLTEAQCVVICKFLLYVATHGHKDELETESAKSSLAAGWGDYCPEEQA